VTVGADSNDQKNYIIDKVALFKPNETPPEVIDGTLQLGSSFLICLQTGEQAIPTPDYSWLLKNGMTE
jgi:hypothetical protein